MFREVFKIKEFRNIISIDEEKCDGCGLCADACHEGAIEIVDGKARLISEAYCDGLGDCLPACPQDAIKIDKREAEPFDQEAVQARIKEGCPSGNTCSSGPEKIPAGPALKQWPIQIHLLPPFADFFQGASLLIAADCTAFAAPGLQQELREDRVTLIGCPKLDNREAYLEKLTAIFQHNDIRHIRIVRMVVPCCSGISGLVEAALKRAGRDIPREIIILGIDGQIQEKKGA